MRSKENYHDIPIDRQTDRQGVISERYLVSGYGTPTQYRLQRLTIGEELHKSR